MKVLFFLLLPLAYATKRAEDKLLPLTVEALRSGKVRMYIPCRPVNKQLEAIALKINHLQSPTMGNGLFFFMSILLAASGEDKEKQDFQIPDVKIEVLKTGIVRAYIPHINGIKLFAIHANVNETIDIYEPGTYSKETTTKDSSWVLTLDIPLTVGDVLYYWVTLILNTDTYTALGSWTVKELKTSFPPLAPKSSACHESATVAYAKAIPCIDSRIFEDSFNGPTLDRSKWLVHHRIPTYTGPNYEFNSYLDVDNTRFIKDGVLYLKPIPLIYGHDVRGTLNLTDKCTSSRLHECLYTQKSSFLLPVVKSAMITSKFSFKYGKVEVKAKLPSGDWIVPIMHLEDKGQSDGVNSPKVWIAYSRGNRDLIGYGTDDYGARLLFGGPVVYPIEPLRSKFLASRYSETPVNDDFHLFTLEWKPGKMTFYIDGVVYGDLPTADGFAEYSVDARSDWEGPDAPYNREYILSFGVAVGGLYDFPDGFNSKNDPKPWNNTERNYMTKFFDARGVWMKTWHGDDVALKIDYVKVTSV